MTIEKPTKIMLKKCPNCDQMAIYRFKPFCSSRCSQLDLSKWLNEDYRVPLVEVDDFNEPEFFDDES